MKYLQRYLSLLFALVMCVGLFSITAHAEEIEVDNYHVYVSVSYNNNGGSSGSVGAFTFYPNNGTQETKTLSFYEYAYTDFSFFSEHTFATDTGSFFVKKGRNVNITIENISDTIAIGSDTGSLITSSNVTNATLYAIYTDGTREAISADWDNKVKGVNINASFTPAKDLDKFLVSLTRTIPYEDFKRYLVLAGGQYRGAYIDYIVGEYDADTDYKLTVERSSEESGLLSGIIDKLTSGFSALGDKLSNVVNGIIELPQKLWNLISDGLKSLFVPSEESMTAYKDKWDTLLADRFGAVYQVCDIVTDSWSEIGNADTSDTINFPSVTIPLPDDAQFTFGGYDVKIVPEGFDVLVQAIKLIVGIVCTLAFINGMLRRYDELMGVEQ